MSDNKYYVSVTYKVRTPMLQELISIELDRVGLSKNPIGVTIVSAVAPTIVFLSLDKKIDDIKCTVQERSV